MQFTQSSHISSSHACEIKTYLNQAIAVTAFVWYASVDDLVLCQDPRYYIIMDVYVTQYMWKLFKNSWHSTWESDVNEFWPLVTNIFTVVY